MKKDFSQFTNLYSLSKTLRFELVPVGNTQGLLDTHEVSEKGRMRREKYEKTKPFIDKLHREFVKLALSNLKLDGAYEYFDSYKKYKKDKKNKKSIENLKKVGRAWSTSRCN